MAKKERVPVDLVKQIREDGRYARQSDCCSRVGAPLHATIIFVAIAFARSARFHPPCDSIRSCRLPVVNFAAGGVATPADAAMMMQLGCDGVFVGSVSDG